MSDLEKTKRFNIEDINVDAHNDEPEEKINEEVAALEENMDELDEIISEDENSKDFIDDGFEIEFDEGSEENKATIEETNGIINTEKESPSDFEKEKEKIIDEFNNTHEFKDELVLEDEEKNEEVDSELASIVKNDYQEKTIVEMEIPKDKTIGIASDHRGFRLKQKLTKYLEKKGYTVIDFGTDNTKSTDYPEFGFKLGEAVAAYEVEKGIAICGSGIGISIACNKIKGVRCAKVDNVKETKYARKDNDANVIAIAGNMPTFRAKDIVDAYLKTKFTGLERHKRRIEMLDNRG